MITRYMAAATAALIVSVTGAAAQSCGGIYTVKSGDTLSQISDEQYKDARKWSAIYSNNLQSIGGNPNAINVGQKLNLSCIGGLPTGLEGGATTAAAAVETQTAVTTTATAETTTVAAAATDVGTQRVSAKKISLLTGTGYAPFTDQGLPNGGLFNEIVQATMENSEYKDDHKIYWVNVWDGHLKTLLADKIFDVGYPWAKPDCTSTPDAYRCTDLLFADPMFEMLILLFTAKSNPIAYENDSDLEGKSLCRPVGYSTHIFNQDGRNWLTENKINFVQPETVKECYDKLLTGEVDAVVMNEFTGRSNIKSLDIVDQVDVVSTRPLAIQGLHVVVHKSHPQAEELLDTINSNLTAIKASGKYQSVIDSHMTRIWQDF